ncbi:site-specific DNA-methyltransferase [Aestuariimicrobium ganziense]|uniref:site-specific DNA-methyltransferase n=1 Tax=Aestuariimicrobium ganziense TaxID=2773677 RepID=UPI001942E3AE|nr:site-specific DNA-methyltransferase [Aestuariimicrobium ganziense]
MPERRGPRVELVWPGKDEALALAEVPPRSQLVGDLNAGQVFLEGDNLEVLKHLVGTHTGAVKLIYIDPPYNTGKSFVYRDDEHPDHAAWLSMMAPRLVLARRLLTDDGVIAVSIDSGEVHHLALLMDEVFGEANRLNDIVWVSNLKGRQLEAPGAAVTHEHILVYARDAGRVPQFRGSLAELHALMPSVYKRAGYPIQHDDRGPFVTKNELHNTNSRFNEQTAPSMVFRIHHHPGTGEVRVTDIDDETVFPGFVTAMPHPNAREGVRFHAWRWSRARVLAEHAELKFDTAGDRLRIWTKIRDTDGVALKDLVIGPGTLTGQADLAALGLARVFDTPKPVALLRPLIAAATGPDDLVLDFFAGSGSTGHAVALQNSLDGGRRRCLSVNNAEPTHPRSIAAAQGFASVADITRSRLDRVLAVVPGAAEAGLGLAGLRESGGDDA